MKFEIYNTGIEPFVIYSENGIHNVLPGENCILEANTQKLDIKICHVINEKFNTIWYILNDIFTLEQMRTVLVVDGEYTLTSFVSHSSIKIKNHEYVFDKNMSYETYVFSSDDCKIVRTHLWVNNSNKIYQKAKWLYLIGGNKTMLPLSGIALVSLCIKTVLSPQNERWVLGLLVFLFLYFGFRLNIYFKSLRDLKNAMKEHSILSYMNSNRIEYRKFTDNLNSNYFNTSEKNDIYI